MSARLLKDPSTANCRIFIGNLQTDEMTKMELEEHFSKYGQVIGALMNRGFGFVQFENEESAQAAIRNEAGQMLKGRRIDVKPAKKDGNSSFSNQQFPNRSQPQRNMSFPPGQSFTPSQSFSSSTPQNTSFNNSNQQNSSFNSSNQQNSSFEDPPKSSDNPPQRDFTEDQEDDLEDDQKFSENQNNNFTQDKDDEFPQHQNRSEESGGNSNGSNANSGPNNNQGKANNQNRPGNNQNQNQNQNKNQNNQGGNQTRTRGSRGGKNRNKNRDNLGNNFRDRSPLNRGREEMTREWEMNKMRTGFGPRDYNEPRFDDRFRDMMPGPNVRPMGHPDYPPAEKNDCEIIVVHKSLTEYAEAIEARLKKMGLTVDLLFPNEEVSLSRVLGNIANRGCLYAVVVVPINLEHHSLTLNILHGLPQEHRNMPVEDALNLISRDFSNYKSGGRGVPLNTPFTSDRHPDAIQVLLNMLADNHQLTVLQYDRVLKYLEIKREEQVQVELGDAKDMPGGTMGVSDPKQAELQSRILNILNSNRPNANAPAPSPVPAPAPVPVPPATWAAGVERVFCPW
ncbi:nuclear receptor coactivator 5-like isoform X2 [Fopius arisanus]|uniref:Nuclear receptor coactivator 5-like isoform X2 n=1 Tax=Fopius arisanus TaxID=64838 RepID=A0A9R1U8F8_9HYME|nr:PREDICTED: nuclear receptor coactivator 5-like isoform X2 [Fopius arisanus]